MTWAHKRKLILYGLWCLSNGIILAHADSPASSSSETASDSPSEPSPDSSLLLTAQERHAIDTALTIRDKKARGNRVYLNGLIFLEPQEWTLWLNEKRFTSQTPPDELPVAIAAVYPDHIEITQGEGTVELRPNQTYLVDEGRCVEGDDR